MAHCKAYKKGWTKIRHASAPYLEFLSKLWFLRHFIIENQKTLIRKKESTSGIDTDFLCL